MPSKTIHDLCLNVIAQAEAKEASKRQKKEAWPWPKRNTDLYAVLSVVQALGPCRVEEVRAALKEAGHNTLSKYAGQTLHNLKTLGWIGNALPGHKRDGAVWFYLDRPSPNLQPNSESA